MALAIAAMTLSGCDGLDPGAKFPTTDVVIAATELTVWVADEPDERRQGLREVESLPDGIDGMLFRYAAPTLASYGMLDTPIPLDIWWFDGNGRLIGTAEMEPCPAEPCPSYQSPGLVLTVLETPQGAHHFQLGDELSNVENG